MCVCVRALPTKYSLTNLVYIYIYIWMYMCVFLYGITKVKVCSPDWNTDNFNIVAGVLQGDTLVPCLFVICLDYMLRTSIDKMKDNGFKLAKERSRRYSAQTITDADYADDIVLLANTPIPTKTIYIVSNEQLLALASMSTQKKTEYMCFNQRGDISTLNGSSLKQVDKFTYVGSSVSSTEKDTNMWLTKAWTAIDWLPVIWKSDLTDKIKRSFFQALQFTT